MALPLITPGAVYTVCQHISDPLMYLQTLIHPCESTWSACYHTCWVCDEILLCDYLLLFSKHKHTQQSEHKIKDQKDKILVTMVIFLSFANLSIKLLGEKSQDVTSLHPSSPSCVKTPDHKSQNETTSTKAIHKSRSRRAEALRHKIEQLSYINSQSEETCNAENIRPLQIRRICVPNSPLF